MSVITLCSDILLLIQKEYYVLLSAVTKSVEIQRAPTLVLHISKTACCPVADVENCSGTYREAIGDGPI
jgi:hypothetical protein